MSDLNYGDVRVWQTHFSILHPLQNLPVPEMIVEEIQRNPHYRWDGSKRFEDGAQLVITLGGRGGIKIGEKEFSLTAGK